MQPTAARRVGSSKLLGSANCLRNQIRFRTPWASRARSSGASRFGLSDNGRLGDPLPFEHGQVAIRRPKVPLLMICSANVCCQHKVERLHKVRDGGRFQAKYPRRLFGDNIHMCSAPSMAERRSITLFKT
jgi:hypothetical protein